VHEAAERCDPKALCQICPATSRPPPQPSTLNPKPSNTTHARQALRRLRLPLFYDSTAWVLPAGSLTHLMITLPYWTRRGAARPLCMLALL
jgi:hypothetical protein